MEGRKDQYKAKGLSSQERRRQALLTRQKEQRRSAFMAARLEALVASRDAEGAEEARRAPADVDVEMENAADDRVLRDHRRVARLRRYADILMHPEVGCARPHVLCARSSHSAWQWMVDVPADLGAPPTAPETGWVVMPRPEGTRCLVIAARCVRG